MSSAAHSDLEIDSSVNISTPAYGQVAALAYQLWEERGCPMGSPDMDWFLAEAELAHRKGVSAVAA